MQAQVYSDGGARPTNPGHAGFGVMVVPERGRVVKVGRYIGIRTNNYAEFAGLIVGLKIARDIGAESIVVTCDSKLVIEQTQGNWRCNSDELRPLMHQAQSLAGMFELVEWVHVRGHRGHAENELVDQLCTEAILAGMTTNARNNPFTRNANKRSEGKVVDPFALPSRA